MSTCQILTETFVLKKQIPHFSGRKMYQRFLRWNLFFTQSPLDSPHRASLYQPLPYPKPKWPNTVLQQFPTPQCPQISQLAQNSSNSMFRILFLPCCLLRLCSIAILLIPYYNVNILKTPESLLICEEGVIASGGSNTRPLPYLLTINQGTTHRVTEWRMPSCWRSMKPTWLFLPASCGFLLFWWNQAVCTPRK